MSKFVSEVHSLFNPLDKSEPRHPILDGRSYPYHYQCVWRHQGNRDVLRIKYRSGNWICIGLSNRKKE